LRRRKGHLPRDSKRSRAGGARFTHRALTGSEVDPPMATSGPETERSEPGRRSSELPRDVSCPPRPAHAKP